MYWIALALSIIALTLNLGIYAFIRFIKAKQGRNLNKEELMAAINTLEKSKNNTVKYVVLPADKELSDKWEENMKRLDDFRRIVGDKSTEIINDRVMILLNPKPDDMTDKEWNELIKKVLRIEIIEGR